MVITEKLRNKVAIITGSTRGIGRAIAEKLATLGCRVVITGKSVVEDSRLGGTIYSVAQHINNQGGNAIAVKCDVRHETDITQLIDETVANFGGIDLLVNNASAIRLTDTEQTEAKYFDLMHQVNVRGSFLMVHHALPYLKKSLHAHILNISPPLNLKSRWLQPHVAYTLSKYNMTMLAMGWAAEFKQYPIAANTLWPKTIIDTAAVRNLLGGEPMTQRSRKPQIMADAAVNILAMEPHLNSGNSFIDEELLKQHGVVDFEKYAVDPQKPLFPDLFLDE